MNNKRKTARILAASACILLSAVLLTLSLTAHAENAPVPKNDAVSNMPPVAEHLEFTTFRDVSLTEKLKATDPEGDVLSYEIVTSPKKGEVKVSDEGVFMYTPKEGYKGKDSFTYVAVDVCGNVSEEAAVKIVMKKQSTKTTYADMKGNSAEYAALNLAEKGIFTGEMLGDEYFFKPGQAVTRGEFLAMCLKTVGTETLTGVTRTGFSDDATIPAWVKPYVSTALMSGVISGYKDTDGKLVFSPHEPITFSEASVILNNVLELSDVVSVAAIEADPEVPVWAYTAAANLNAHNVIPDGVSDFYNQQVTRADAAKMLLASGSIHEENSGGTSLLGWAK